MGPLRFMTAGNFSHMVSYPAWHHCISPQQETFMNLSKLRFYLV